MRYASTLAVEESRGILPDGRNRGDQDYKDGHMDQVDLIVTKVDKFWWEKFCETYRVRRRNRRRKEGKNELDPQYNWRQRSFSFSLEGVERMDFVEY